MSSVSLKDDERRDSSKDDSPDESDRATEEDGIENVGVPTAEPGRGGKVNVVNVDPTEPVDPREEERIVAAREGDQRAGEKDWAQRRDRGLTHRS